MAELLVLANIEQATTVVYLDFIKPFCLPMLVPVGQACRVTSSVPGDTIAIAINTIRFVHSQNFETLGEHKLREDHEGGHYREADQR